MRAAVIQLTSRGEVEENLDRAAERVAEAAARGAELAVLPENFALLADNEEKKFAVADTLSSSQIVIRMGKVAQQHKIALVLGGFPERAEDKSRVHNTAVYVDASGEVKAAYRKIHLFDAAVGDGQDYHESRTVAPGLEPVLVETPWGGLGLSVCYDIRFPELYRRLSLQGAKMLVIPAAFTRPTGEAHWEVLLRARAIENQCFVLAAAQVGTHNPKRQTWGHSMIIDPWGRILVQLRDEESIGIAELDFTELDRIRRAVPSLVNRRLD